MISRISLCSVTFFKLFRTSLQIIYGTWRLSALKSPLVTIFGSARAAQNTPFAQHAYELSKKLVDHGISIVTGGGPGIMNAANCGAISHKRTLWRSIGIGVKELGEGKNKCVQEYFELDYFFARKWLLTHYSVGFVVFPGSFGTLDELTEVLTLIKTKKMKRVPVILFGSAYWHDFMVWMKKELLSHEFASQEELNLLILTDNLEEVLCLLIQECTPYKESAIKKK